jgi:hypothetical protein
MSQEFRNGTESLRSVMDLKSLLDTPPWDWPRDAGKAFQKVLLDGHADESDRLVGATLAGSLTVINDDLADVLLVVVGNANEPERLRAKAAVSLGPVLEQAERCGFEDPDDVPITERAFRNIQDSLQRIYRDKSTPMEVRRRILEASVRAPETWHQNAIGDAYSSGNAEWMLTAVFSMRWVRGFDTQILSALESADPEIHYEAVNAAGAWELDAAWPHVVKLVNDANTPRSLLFAAIGSVGAIRPAEARKTLADLADSDDEEIAGAVIEAMSMDEADSYGEDDEDFGDSAEIKWVN